MKKSWTKPLGLALAGAALLFGRGHNAEPSYDAYNKNMYQQDSIYATRIAETIYAYHADSKKGEPIFKRISLDSVGAYYMNGVTAHYHRNNIIWDATKPIDLNAMSAEARLKGRRYLVLDDINGGTYVADTADVNDLIDHAQDGLTEGNVSHMPVHVEFLKEKNAHALYENAYNLRAGLYLNIGLLTDHEKPVVYAVTDHEVGHFIAQRHEDEMVPPDMHGHFVILSEDQKWDIAEEDFCDKNAASKKDFNARSLAGLAYFLTDRGIDESQWHFYDMMPRAQAIAELAKYLIMKNKQEVCETEKHRPNTYRIMAMSETSGIPLGKPKP